MLLNKGAYLFWNNLEKTQSSTSAGAFILIADAFLRTYKNSEVYGVVINDENTVVHTVANTSDELIKMQGSKYVQSAMGDTFRRVKKSLQQGKKVLFSGTGCQIKALQNYVQKDIDYLYTIEILCHGVPSPKLWSDYLKALQNEYGAKLCNISFRNKSKCDRLGYSLTFEVNGKKHLIYPDEDFYYTSFLNGDSLRPSCYSCPFVGVRSYGDILLGDSNNQLFHSDEAISLVNINTQKGIYLFDLIDDKYEIKEADVLEESVNNKKLVVAAALPNCRDRFYKNVFENGVFKYIYKPNFLQYIKNRMKFLVPTKCKNLIKKVIRSINR